MPTPAPPLTAPSWSASGEGEVKQVGCWQALTHACWLVAARLIGQSEGTCIPCVWGVPWLVGTFDYYVLMCSLPLLPCMNMLLSLPSSLHKPCSSPSL